MMTISFCLPCSRQSAVENLTHDLSIDTTNKSGITPTRAEYASQAGRDFLTILEAVAQAVPVPGFSAAVKVAVGIVKACEEKQATLESAIELKDRIQELVVVFVDELKGVKKAEDIRPELIRDIGILKEEMEYVKARLDEITSQHRFLLLFFRSINDNKVSKCVTRLNNAMEKFTLKRTVDNANMFSQLKKQITAFYNQQKGDLEVLRLGMEDVKTMLDDLRLGGATSVRLRAPIPVNSAIFHGRDALITELVGIITRTSREHICLLGPGGMGKTSTSLVVMSHPDVTAKYKDHLRVWVPCVKAMSASLFLDTLQSSLAVPNEAGDIRGAIIATLRTSPPIVILLDNFETPWDADGAQMEVAQLLRDIHAIPHITLFITMRSSAPPCDDIPWHHAIDLRGVDAAAARDIYAARYPEGRHDPNLLRLLELIGHMPLAITLMAQIAKVTHLSAVELINEYDKLGTSMLGQGSDAVSSMNVCIGLSVYSSRMKAHPEAFNLLCALSMLPTGTSYDMLSKWWARDLLNLPGALNILRGVSLVEERGSTYFVLPVIQRYILDPIRFNPEVHASMIESACAFLKQHESKLGDPSYKSHVAALSQEEDNLEAILLQVTTSDPHIIQDGLLLLACYQQDCRPQVDIVEHALRLVQAINNHLLQGEILYCYGAISRRLDQYEKSLQLCQEALDLFLSVPHKKKAAESRLGINSSLSHLSAGCFDMQEQIIQEAQRDFESVNDVVGVGCCLSALGALHMEHSKDEIAHQLLKKAEEILAKVKDPGYHHAVCTMQLAWFYYFTSQYDLAYFWTVSSLEECKSIGDSLGYSLSLNHLGQLASACSDYKGSLNYYLQSLKLETSMGISPSGENLEGLGLAWAKLGKTMDACKAFEEALQQYSSQKLTKLSQMDILRLQFFLEYLKNSKVYPGTDELEALYFHYSPDHVDKILAAS